MKAKTIAAVLAFLFLYVSPPLVQAWPTSQIGQHMSDLEAQKQKKAKELQNLKNLKKIVNDQIATAKAEMAQNMTSTVEKVGRVKADPNGLVTTAGGVSHSPSKHWKMNFENLRKEYENAGIYKPDEIDTIIEFHKSYVQNQGFTAGIAEQLAQVAEATAQKRTIEGYIERKEKEIAEVENAIKGAASANSSKSGSFGSQSNGGNDSDGGY